MDTPSFRVNISVTFNKLFSENNGSVTQTQTDQ